jgi:hypothetical protein
MEYLKKKIEETAKSIGRILGPHGDNNVLLTQAFEEGALSPEAKEYWQQEMYTKEEILKLLNKYTRYVQDQDINEAGIFPDKWLEQNKKK